MERGADPAAAASRASSAPGCCGPSHVGEPWHVVFRFDTPAHLRDWEDSPERAEQLAPARSSCTRTDMHRVSGLETWFALPGRTAPAPPRWKMFLVSLAAIYTLQLVFNLLVGPLGLAVPLRVGLVTVGVTFLMTWLVMPWAARVLQDWLYAPPATTTA